MTRALLALLIVITTSVAANSRTSPTEDLRLQIDWAHANSGYPVIAGWGFVCGSDRMTERLDLVATRVGSAPIVVPSGFVRALYRSDVYLAFSSECPGLTFYSGWHLYGLEALPPGEWTLQAVAQGPASIVAMSRAVVSP